MIPADNRDAELLEVTDELSPLADLITNPGQCWADATSPRDPFQPAIRVAIERCGRLSVSRRACRYAGSCTICRRSKAGAAAAARTNGWKRSLQPLADAV